MKLRSSAAVTAIVTILLLGGNATPEPEWISFAWEYDETIEIDGFKLYIDNEVAVVMEPDYRSISIQLHEDDVDVHEYYATAFLGDEESLPSDIVTK